MAFSWGSPPGLLRFYLGFRGRDVALLDRGGRGRRDCCWGIRVRGGRHPRHVAYDGLGRRLIRSHPAVSDYRWLHKPIETESDDRVQPEKGCKPRYRARICKSRTQIKAPRKRPERRTFISRAHRRIGSTAASGSPMRARSDRRPNLSSHLDPLAPAAD